MLGALGFFALVEVVGLAAAPLAALAFGRLPGAGLGFAKPLGVLLVTWAAWMLVSLHIVHYSTATAVAVLIALVVAGVAAALRQRALSRRLESGSTEGRFGRWRAGRLAARALPAHDPARRPLWLRAAMGFARAVAPMALLVASSPGVWDTGKPLGIAVV